MTTHALKAYQALQLISGLRLQEIEVLPILNVEATAAVQKDKLKGIAVSSLLQTTARLVILPGSLHGHQVKFVLLWASFGTSIASRQILRVLYVEITTESH